MSETIVSDILSGFLILMARGQLLWHLIFHGQKYKSSIEFLILVNIVFNSRISIWLFLIASISLKKKKKKNLYILIGCIEDMKYETIILKSMIDNPSIWDICGTVFSLILLLLIFG